MQNSFASKKHDFNKAERDGNTNINTNTNTNNIDSTVCGVEVTCPEGSTTVRQTPTPTTGTLVIEKICPECGSVTIVFHTDYRQ